MNTAVLKEPMRVGTIPYLQGTAVEIVSADDALFRQQFPHIQAGTPTNLIAVRFPGYERVMIVQRAQLVFALPSEDKPSSAGRPFGGADADEQNALWAAIHACGADAVAGEADNQAPRDAAYEFLENTPRTSLVIELIDKLHELGWQLARRKQST